MSIQNNSIINLDDQGDEDYSHESSLLPSNKKNHSELVENFLIFGNISKLGIK
ncbi:11022_t:CDS:1, partial [Entrophospora sp. SA101]